MSVTYSTGRIQFIPTDSQQPTREYSERSMIELRVYGDNTFSLRALDLKHDSTEIFNLPLEDPNMYKFGSSPDIEDEVRCKKGIYCLLLNSQTRDGFHKVLRTVFNELALLKQDPSRTSPDNSRTKQSMTRLTKIADQDNIIVQIHKLIECIEFGKANSAARQASELASKGIKLKLNTLNARADTDDDEEITIRVKIDGMNISNDETNELYSLTVYKSTKINELRVLFQHRYGFPTDHQYFFVNGRLAYDQMSLLAYSTCRINYTLNNTQNPEREYSERSVVELRLDDNQNVSLRAVDVEPTKIEIFNFPIKSRSQYQFGSSQNQCDLISDSNGTYRLWLTATSRDEFHQTFHGLLDALIPNNSNTTTSSFYVSPPEVKPSMSTTRPSQPPRNRKISTRDPVSCNLKDILTDVRNLNKFIEQGRVDEAVQLTKRFISQGIHLEAKSLESFPNETEFQVNIRVDGNEYNIDQSGGTIPMNVFPSTTVRELRAAFEVAYQCSPPNQYVFVNGEIAHDDSTMRDLKVGPNSLFVLFLLGCTKQFEVSGPWKCVYCSTQNEEDNMKCRICSAFRKE